MDDEKSKPYKRSKEWEALLDKHTPGWRKRTGSWYQFKLLMSDGEFLKFAWIVIIVLAVFIFHRVPEG